MSRKLKNLERIWNEEGFRIVQNKANEWKGVTLEILVHFVRLDGQPTSFIDQWQSIRNAAERQSFYAFPIEEHSAIKVSSVLLVKKESISYPPYDWQALRRSLANTYWSIQEDEEIMQLSTRLHSLKMAAMLFHEEVIKMHSKTPESLLLENPITYEKWGRYKESVFECCQIIRQSKKVEQSVKVKAAHMESQFGL